MTVRKLASVPTAGWSGTLPLNRPFVKRRAPHTEAVGRMRLVTVHIDSRHLRSARQTLHRALGSEMNLYVAKIDNRDGQASLQIELEADRVGEIMSLLMRTLPEAEFGAIRPARRMRAH
jgi:hypothetical protein